MKIQTILQKEERYERRGCCLHIENTNVISTRRKTSTSKRFPTNTQHKTEHTAKEQQTTYDTHTYSICNYILTDTTHTSRPNVQHNQNVRTSNCAK